MAAGKSLLWLISCQHSCVIVLSIRVYPQAAPRFIPACAGNTAAPQRSGGGPAVHPRLCGEHVQIGVGTTQNGGSSPPVRGTLVPSHRQGPAAGFIPACAGNTTGRGPWAVRTTVHPRLCGEHRQRHVRIAGHVGSSPPVRGTPVGLHAEILSERFIPACAGNTAPGRERAARLRFIPACAGNTHVAVAVDHVEAVHPRLCGEH